MDIAQEQDNASAMREGTFLDSVESHIDRAFTHLDLP